EQAVVAALDLELTEPSPAIEDDEHREARLERARADPLGAEEGVRDWVLSPVERPEIERLEPGVEVEPAVEAERAPLEQHREVGRLLELEDEDPLADRVGDAGWDEDVVAGADRPLVQQLEQVVAVEPCLERVS